MLLRFQEGNPSRSRFARYPGCNCRVAWRCRILEHVGHVIWSGTTRSWRARSFAAAEKPVNSTILVPLQQWLSHWRRDKMADLSQMVFSNAFWRMEFIVSFAKVCHIGFTWSLIIDSGNCWASNRRQAITLNNAQWHIHASPGRNE